MDDSQGFRHGLGLPRWRFLHPSPLQGGVLCCNAGSRNGGRRLLARRNRAEDGVVQETIFGTRVAPLHMRYGFRYCERRYQQQGNRQSYQRNNRQAGEGNREDAGQAAKRASLHASGGAARRRASRARTRTDADRQTRRHAGRT